MTGVIYLDIAIGLVFLILIVSFFAGAAQEAVAAVFKWKAKAVRSGVKQLVGEADFDAVWNAPLIEALRGRWLFGRRDPSEIPPRIFAKVVLDHTGLSEADNIEQWVAEHRRGDRDTLQRRVATVLIGAPSSMPEIEREIAVWYAAGMDRVDGGYIRRTQSLLFVYGFLIAAITNTDPISYAVFLRENDEARQRVALMAAEVAALEEIDDIRASLELSTPSTDDAVTGPTSFDDVRRRIADETTRLTERLGDVSAPSGWRHCGRLSEQTTDPETGAVVTTVVVEQGRWSWPCFAYTTGGPFRFLAENLGVGVGSYDHPTDNAAPGQSLWSPLFGWILLGFAVMLGSQFWIDLLKQFVSIRSALRPRPRSRQDDPTRDDIYRA